MKASMRPNYIKIKCVAVAINPVDLHICHSGGGEGGILGCDVAGIVEEVGKDCQSQVSKGDHVYGVCHGANINGPEDGGFAEFAMLKDGLLGKIPEGLSFEDAATFGLGVTTVGQALYMILGFPLPTEPKQTSKTILIHGGSGATGTLAIQYAKMSGLRVITTASSKNFDLVKSRGADEVFDYHDPDCASKIKSCCDDKLHLVLNCVGTKASHKVVADAFPEKSDEEMKLVTVLRPDDWPRKDVNAQSFQVFTTFGERYWKWENEYPALPQHYEFGVKFWKIHSDLLFAGKIKPHPVELGKGGFHGILKGMYDVATCTISGAKLVFNISDEAANVVADAESRVALKDPTTIKR